MLFPAIWPLGGFLYVTSCGRFLPMASMSEEEDKRRRRERAAAWRKANPEESRARGRKYYAENRDKVKISAANSHKKYRGDRLRRSIEWRERNPRRYLFLIAKNRAIRSGHEFTITENDITWPERCPISGVLLEYGGSKRSASCASLDRIDNEKGYVPGNVAIISLRMNILKRDGSLSEFESIIKYIREINVKALY